MYGDEGILSVRRVRAAFVAVGGGLLAFTAVELYVWGVVYSYVGLSFVAGLLFSIPANVVLIGAGWWYPRLGISERRIRGIAAWTLGGTVLLGLFSLTTGVTFFPDTVWAQLSSVRWGLSVGAGTGLLVGVVNARGIERALAAERAQLRAAEAERSEEFLEYMNALLRHEVLNTANVIGGYAALLGDEVAESETDVAAFTEIIQRQTEELTTVIDDARLLTRIDADDETFESVDLRAILETELQNVRDRYDSGDAEMRLDLVAPDEVCVRGDDLLRRVFSNVLMNAVEHNDGARKRVEVVVDADDERVTVDVRDNGPGIPEGDCDDLFDLRVTEGVNHGLGLTIVARLVDRYGGDVGVTETGPDGTTISVSLPRTDAPPTATVSPASRPADRSVAGW